MAHYVRQLLCEHTHLVWRKYNEAEVLIISSVEVKAKVFLSEVTRVGRKGVEDTQF